MSTKVEPVDFTGNNFKFGFNGAAISQGLLGKVADIDSKVYELMTMLAREIGDDKIGTVALLCAMQLPSEQRSEKASYLASLANKINSLNSEKAALAAIATGISSTIVYLLDVDQIRRFGL